MTYPGAVVGVGSVIDGRYEVEGLLGEGGMGVVMRARHRFTGATVALKMLHPHLRLRSDLAARFLVEARAPAAIGHPGIVGVLDGGVTSEGDPYFAMELLQGEPLHQLMRRGPLAFETARHICLQILDALGAAHAAGFIHRDLKPENVFIQSPSGTVKLLDFGITKSLSDAGEDSSTRTGATMGTLLYMSPEQLRNAKRVDHRTDLWAVGVIFRQMVAGELPFRAESLGDMLVLVWSQPPRPLGYDLVEVPAELEAVMGRALAADPNLRFASAYEMAHAIAGLPSLRLQRAGGVAAEGWPAPLPAVAPTITAAPAGFAGATAPPLAPPGAPRSKLLWILVPLALGIVAMIVVVLSVFGVGGWLVASGMSASAPGCERACTAMRACGLPGEQKECVADCQSSSQKAQCLAAAGASCDGIGACYVESMCKARPRGSMSCGQTLTCEASCEPKDVGCVCGCLENAAPSAASGIVIQNACVLRYCEDECAGEQASRVRCNACGSTRCAKEIAACAPAAEPPAPSPTEKAGKAAPVPVRPAKPPVKPKDPEPPPEPGDPMQP